MLNRGRTPPSLQSMELRDTDVMTMFVQAGWTPERRSAVAVASPVGHPAANLLATFAGLRIGSTGPGSECAKSDVHFTQDVEDLPEADALARFLGEVIVPIGEIHNAHGLLYIGESGRCFGVSLMHEAVWLEGENFEDAIRSLTMGRRVRPILLPGLESTELYGESYSRGDPRLYDPAKHRDVG
jgi:hypothetical protein